MKTTYVAVGFKLDKVNSVFYFSCLNFDEFLIQLRNEMLKNNPQIVSIRVVSY